MSKFVHMELNTSDPEAAQKFYKAIFGWKYTKMKMADGSVYVGFTGDGDGAAGGIQKSPNPETPPHWMGYVGVESIKKTVAKVEKNGGKVHHQADVPTMGSLAILTDPQGAWFAIWQPAMRAPEQAAGEPEAAPEAAPAKAGKKAGGKKAAKKEAAAADPTPEPAKASKKAAKKKAATQEAAEPPAPAAAPAKAGKKAGKKQAAAPEPPAAPAKKKTAKKKTTKKG